MSADATRRRFFFTRRAGACCAAVLGFLAAGCGDDAATGGGSVIGDDGLVESELRSAHYDAVVRKVGVGGEFFMYADVEGDAMTAAEDLDAVLKAFGGSMDDVPSLKSLSIPTVVKDLGLRNVRAVGMSSVAVSPDTYHNQSFLYIPSGREGLLRALGGEPGPLRTKSLAPVEADFVFEQEFNFKPVYDVIVSWERMLGGGGASGGPSFKEMAEAQLEALSLSLAEFLGETNGRFIAIAEFGPKQPFPIPLPGAMPPEDGEMPEGPEIPSIDFLIGISEVPMLYDRLLAEARDSEDIQLKDGAAGLIMPAPLPFEGPIGIYEPVAVFREDNHGIFVASRIEFADACFGSGPKLPTHADFASVTSRLPEQGNGFTYVSQDLVDQIKDLISTASEMAPVENEAAPSPEALFKILGLIAPGLTKASAQVIVNQDDGIYVAQNSPASHKRMLANAINPTGIAMLASFAVPAFSKIQDRGETTKRLNELRQVLLALKLYAVDNNGNYPPTLSELVDFEVIEPDQAVELLMDVDPDTGFPEEIIYVPGLTDSDPGETLVIASPVATGDGMRIVSFNDGATMPVPEDVFQTLLEDARALAESRTAADDSAGDAPEIPEEGAADDF